MPHPRPQLHPVLTPTAFASLSLRNRAAVAPMTRVSASADGVPTPEMLRYYAAYAEGGFGLVITEGTYTDLAHAQGYANQPGLATDEQAGAWRHIAEVVHAAGAAIIAQLMHAGALVQGNRYRPTPIAPSAIRPVGEMMSEYGGEGPYHLPAAMDAGDMRRVVDGFAESAARARAAGFDGVEIHGANGYLLDQFLTTYTNARTDDYGGPVRNRIRFTEEVVRAVALATGARRREFVVGVRLSEAKVNDARYVWPDGDGRIVFAALRDAGASYIHMAGEGREVASSSLTLLAKQVAGVPVIANGGLHEPDRSARILEEGGADLVALGRAAIANPDWPQRLARNAPFDPIDPLFVHPQATLQNAAARRAQLLAGQP